MHRLMTRLVRQKQLNETYVVKEDALSAFGVQTASETLAAKAFLERELERFITTDEPHLDSIEKEPTSVKRNDKVAEPLRPDQIRPQSQASLFQFDQPPPSPSESSALRQEIRVVLNAAEEEISDLNEIDGEGDTVYIDHRESRSTLPGYLNGLGFQTVFTQLPVGDLRLSERVLIERKTARDLLESVKSGRLLSQSRSLSASAQRPLLLVETGGEAQYSVHPNAVLGALAHITLDLGLPVMMVKGPLEAAHFIAVAARREHDALERWQAYATTTKKDDASVHAALDRAQDELMAIEDNPENTHPWLDDKKQHLERCFEHALTPLVEHAPDLEKVLMAYSPNLGRLFSASAEDIASHAGCAVDQAKRVIELLHQELTNQ